MSDDRSSDSVSEGDLVRDSMASVVGVGRGLWLLPLDVTFKTVGLRYGWLKALFERTPARLLAGLGQLRAERAAWRAVRNVPAYRRFLRTRASAADRCSRSASWGACPRPTSARTSIGSASSNAASMARSPTRARRSTSRAARRALRTTGSAGVASERSPTGTSASSPATPSARRPLVTINAFSMGAWAAGLQHEPRDDAPRDRQVDRPRHRQDPLDARLPGPRLSVPHLRLSTVPQAPPRRGRPSRVPVGRLPAARPRRRRGDDRGASGPPPGPLPIGVLGLRRNRHRDRHGRRIAGERRDPPPRPRPTGRPRGALRPRLAPADGLPVQPAHPLPRGQRGAARSCARSAASTCSPRGSATTSTTRAASSTYATAAATLRRLRLRHRDLGTAPETAGPRGLLPWVRPIPLPVPVDPRSPRRDDQRHGREHLSRGHRDGRLPGRRPHPEAPFVPAVGRSTTRPGRRDRRSRSS